MSFKRFFVVNYANKNNTQLNVKFIRNFYMKFFKNYMPIITIKSINFKNM